MGKYPEILLGGCKMANDRQSQQTAFQMRTGAVERLLQSGEEPELLRAYFGDAEYQELRELARQASRRARRGGPRVLILPGILGSTIGIEGRLLDNTIWFDPVSIIAGELIKLRLRGSRTQGKALGVIPFFYTKLKLRLWWYGYDVDYHSYDWRCSLEVLGEELANRIANEPASEVFLVAHSMGGLVSRAALAVDASKVRRLIMLGTPNSGSFAPVQVFRGVCETVRKVAALDLRHDAEELTSTVFHTFPSIYQMLPAPSKYNRVNLYKNDNWPEGLRPKQSLLDTALDVQEILADADDRFALVAGNNQRTIADLELDNEGQFRYVQTLRGDGTVPLDLATLPNMRAFFVDDTHNGLLGNARVANAIRDILRTGSTDRLPSSPTRLRDARRTTTGDVELAQALPFGGREGDAVTENERRQVLETLFSPPPIDVRTGEPAEITAVSPQAGDVPRLDGVVIGRRRQHRLDIELVNGSIADVDVRACVLGIFQNVTPSGPARLFDELLGGSISELVSRRMFSAGVGEVFILPTGTHGVRAEHLVFAGLGQFDEFGPRVQQLVASNIVRTLVQAGIDEFATVMFGGGSGHESGAALQNLVKGFFDGLLDSDQRFRFRRIVLCEADSDRYAEMKSRLYRMAGGTQFDAIEATITEVAVPPATPLPPTVAARLPEAAEQPVYLTVRHGFDNERLPTIHASLLTAGGKATVLTYVSQFDSAALDAQLLKLGKPSIDLDDFGSELAQLVFTEEMISVLAGDEITKRHLVIVHDAVMSRIPWETMKFGTCFPAAERGVSRRYMADNMAVAKWLQQRRFGAALDVLLIVNPTQDLPGADAEGRIVQQALQDFPSVRVTKRTGAEATRDVLLEDFQSGDYDAIHYAGHAFFDPQTPAGSGILCAEHEVLSGRNLAALGNLPALVFFNACETGRLRNASRPSLRENLERSVGFAESFLRGGIANFVGTYWPVGDSPALTFARQFYGRVLSGESVGHALVQARRKVRDLPSIDWADYIHYGDADFRLKVRYEPEVE